MGVCARLKTSGAAMFDMFDGAEDSVQSTTATVKVGVEYDFA